MSDVDSYGKFLGRQLVVFDVGCRWGFSEAWSQLGKHVKLFGFDPDSSECARLEEQYAGMDVTLIPKALGASVGRQNLFLTREPACSSLYRPDPELTAAMPELACATEVGVIQIDVTTLDSWLNESGGVTADFIKLDVQGAELDVLKGGELCLKSVRGLEVEVEFNPIYQNQPLFGDVDRFLRERGFVLWRLSNFAHYTKAPGTTPTPSPEIFYYDSRPVQLQCLAGQLMWGHAYYVKQEAADGGASLDWRQCLRDAALFQALGFHDLSTRLLRSSCLKGPQELTGLLPDIHCGSTILNG